MAGGKVVVLTSIIRAFLWARAFRPPPQVALKGLARDNPSGLRGQGGAGPL
jgi:hypothetical protein